MPAMRPERRRMVETRVGKERFQGSAQRKREGISVFSRSENKET